jgi:hypothetical protein
MPTIRSTGRTSSSATPPRCWTSCPRSTSRPVTPFATASTAGATATCWCVPFVTRAGSDLTIILKLLDWHSPPDATAPTGAGVSQDVELLYRFLSYDDSATGAFQYVLAVQELWASQRWIHSTVLADAEELAQLTAGGDWRLERPVERVEPSVVRGGADGTHLAVLIHNPLSRHTVTFHRIRIAPDRSIEFAESLLVAAGPRGLLS